MIGVAEGEEVGVIVIGGVGGVAGKYALEFSLVVSRAALVPRGIMATNSDRASNENFCLLESFEKMVFLLVVISC